MKRILISVRQGELIVASVDDKYLLDLDIERCGHEQKKSNIYKGKITHIEQSLDAVFVDYGFERHGFLPLKEIAPNFYPNQTISSHLGVKDLMQPGQEILVQVEKEERGNKGAALSTFITLAGCYLVLMPNNPSSGGISRRIESEERHEMRDILNQLSIPKEMGAIIRTAGVGRESEELEWDLSVLLNLWEGIQHAFETNPSPCLIHQESNVIIRTIRDHLKRDVDEIIVDDEKVFEQILSYIEYVRPDFKKHVKLYQDKIPLFNRFQIESQIESAYQHEIRLPQGGSIVIDHTEALTVIDVNSSRATKGKNIEETAFQTNLEAADEISRQLRLRDLGGLLVIDFIDMLQIDNQKTVENRLRQAMKLDRARYQIGRISRFGLLEMSRQRLRPSLADAALIPCPHCNGQGKIRSVESLASSIMRVVEETISKSGTAQIQLQVPAQVAAYILNELRYTIIELEKKHQISLIILPNPHLDIPDYKLFRIRKDELAKYHNLEKSYEYISKPEIDTVDITSFPATQEKPAFMPTITHNPNALKKPNLLQKLLSLVSSKKTEETCPKETSFTETTKDSNRFNRTRKPPRRNRYKSNTSSYRNSSTQERIYSEQGPETKESKPYKSYSESIPVSPEKPQRERSFESTTSKTKTNRFSDPEPVEISSFQIDSPNESAFSSEENTQKTESHDRYALDEKEWFESQPPSYSDESSSQKKYPSDPLRMNEEGSSYHEETSQESSSKSDPHAPYYKKRRHPNNRRRNRSNFVKKSPPTESSSSDES